jgi:hypothetical protein
MSTRKRRPGADLAPTGLEERENPALSAPTVRRTILTQSIAGKTILRVVLWTANPEQAAPKLRHRTHALLISQVRPARSIFNKMLNFRCSTIAAFVRSP